MILPDDYLKAMSDAAHEVGALLVLDCIASAVLWVDMNATGRRCADLRAAKGVVCFPLCGSGDDVRAGRWQRLKATSDSFADGPEEVACDYGGL